MDTEINIKINNDEAGDKKPDANLTNHTKRVTLDYLKEHGCTRESLEKTANARRHSSQHIIGMKGNLICFCLAHLFPPQIFFVTAVR